ncbi:hypothetical protein VUR80DRAFT_6882 [Thermomyces stellatus]
MPGSQQRGPSQLMVPEMWWKVIEVWASDSISQEGSTEFVSWALVSFLASRVFAGWRIRGQVNILVQTWNLLLRLYDVEALGRGCGRCNIWVHACMPCGVWTRRDGRMRSACGRRLGSVSVDSGLHFPARLSGRYAFRNRVVTCVEDTRTALARLRAKKQQRIIGQPRACATMNGKITLMVIKLCVR